jgi:cytoskeletal protein CcmA (bactofilin family)
MSDRFSSDHSSSKPQIPRRTPDIPSPSVLHTPSNDADGKQLAISTAVSISGEISGYERLIVEDRVDATLKDIKFVEVTQNGEFKGDAEVENAIIARNYEGALKVSSYLEIAGSGTVKGAARYKTIAMASGGQVLGARESTG